MVAGHVSHARAWPTRCTVSAHTQNKWLPLAVLLMLHSRRAVRRQTARVEQQNRASGFHIHIRPLTSSVEPALTAALTSASAIWSHEDPDSLLHIATACAACKGGPASMTNQGAI